MNLVGSEIFSLAVSVVVILVFQPDFGQASLIIFVGVWCIL